jgi:hypothetical protein
MSSLQNIAAQENGGFKELKDKTYMIIDNGSVIDVQPYVNALNTANFNHHRLKSKRNTIMFEEGVKIELFSAEEVLANGISLNTNNFRNELSQSLDKITFQLGVDNFIIEKHVATTKN